jgi:SAM-dependent methyltransferase
MTPNYRKSHLQSDKRRTYHDLFSNDAYRSMVWQLEKSVLDVILRRFLGNREIRYFDFACGTGRILSHLKRYAISSVGVDISPSMLIVARTNNRSAEIIEADLTRHDVLDNRKFDLITTFRFFSNAETDLRIKAIQVLCSHLADSGYLVFNIHKNTGSTRNRIAKLFGRRDYEGVSIEEVKMLVGHVNLEIVETYHLCVFPSSERIKLLPMFILRPIEVMLSKIKFFRQYGENLIFVCAKTAAGMDKKKHRQDGLGIEDKF